eukprot:3487918-Rhodomonas_salina.2
MPPYRSTHRPIVARPDDVRALQLSLLHRCPYNPTPHVSTGPFVAGNEAAIAYTPTLYREQVRRYLCSSTVPELESPSSDPDDPPPFVFSLSAASFACPSIAAHQYQTARRGA